MKQRMSLEGIFRRYGQVVTICGSGDDGEVPVRAFVQPILDERRKQEQMMPAPLGKRNEDRLLYLGRADMPVTAGETTVCWQGRRFAVQTAHPIYVGDTLSHWWAVLAPERGGRT